MSWANERNGHQIIRFGAHSFYVIDAVVDKIMGRSEFKGNNPVDPFCGAWDTRL